MEPEASPEPAAPEPTSSSPDFDLAAWVENDLPAMLEAEADHEQWSSGARPATSYLSDDENPLTAYQRALSDELPDDAGRADRRAFHDAQRAARDAAVAFAQEIADQHEHMRFLLAKRRENERMAGALAAAHQRLIDEEGMPPNDGPLAFLAQREWKRERERKARQGQQGSQVHVRGPEPPASGRW